ncbi:hypothetical protein pdul_cds_913 [Pandoravirus dulcis]|uniref:Uncharacterized protein n=1 Tax=Pandoravirus dulcis TaxID=1349409 RepID=S4VUR5_9VIRU|nr:hypothetical protein pdul_cds_913 [Pandoravirus dulcis]AGO83150.1 hypothetical protein pdul_cds_913 [Pandoravirus dulcis]
MEKQQQTTMAAPASDTQPAYYKADDDIRGLLDVARASLAKAKKSKTIMYKELHKFYVHFAANPTVEVHVPESDWRCASFAEVCAREGFDARKSVQRMRAMLAERIFVRVVLGGAAPDDADVAAALPMSAYDGFVAAIDAQTQGADWAAWSWATLEAWARHDDRRALRTAMADAWETAKRRASETGGYGILSSDLVEAWHDRAALQQPQMPATNCC